MTEAQIAKTQDFKECFATDEGVRVLGHLKDFIKPDLSQNTFDGSGRIDPMMMMKNEGKRAVWCHIDAIINKDIKKKTQGVAKNDRGS